MSDLTPPQSSQGGSGSGDLLPEPRSVSANSGLEWLKEGFSYFKRQPFTWAIMAFLFFLLMLVMSTIPLLSILTNLLSPVFVGGLILGCAAMDRGESINVNYLYAAFPKKAPQLMVVGVLYGLGVVLIVLVLNSMVGGAHSNGLEGVADPAAVTVSAQELTTILLLALVLMIPLFMAYVFAVPMVLFHDISAFEAMKRSYVACIRNLGAVMLFFVSVGVLSIVATIPMGLGFVVLIPMVVGASYAGYKQILRS